MSSPEEAPMTSVEIRSEIPSWEPCKESVETVIRDAFGGEQRDPEAVAVRIKSALRDARSGR